MPRRPPGRPARDAADRPTKGIRPPRPTLPPAAGPAPAQVREAGRRRMSWAAFHRAQGIGVWIAMEWRSGVLTHVGHPRRTDDAALASGEPAGVAGSLSVLTRE